MKISKIILSAAAALMFSAGMISCGSKQEAKDADQAAGQTEVAEPAQAEAEQAVIVLKKGEEMAPADGKLVVIDFNATWCGPCRQFAPHFDAVAERNTGNAVFYSVDVDEHPELAAKYMVESIPMVVYIRPDGTTDSTVGYMDEAQFAAAVAEHLK